MASRIVFFGTAELGLGSLEALAGDSRYEIAAVVTQPDKPRGRDLEVRPSPIKAAALRLGFKVLQPPRARHPDFAAELRALAPCLSVVVAYGQILSQEVLDIPTRGCLNVHASLLPRHRGAAPIQWAILSGDAETGVTIMKMDAGLDTGPILTQRATPIAAEDNARTLHDRLARMGAELLLETIPPYLEGRISPRPQPEGATYARKIEKADGRIHWNEPAGLIWRKIRAFTPWPGAFAFLEMGGKTRLLKILEALPESRSGPPGAILAIEGESVSVACGEGALRILALQLEGRKAMSAREFLAGHKLAAGQVFT